MGVGASSTLAFTLHLFVYFIILALAQSLSCKLMEKSDMKQKSPKTKVCVNKSLLKATTRITAYLLNIVVATGCGVLAGWEPLQLH